jgi:hypothetical protein
MISRHIPIRPQNDRYGRLASYIAAIGAYADRKEKPAPAWCAGCLEGQDYAESISEVEDTQELNTRARSNKTYHLVISFRPEDAAKLTPEALREIERRFAAVLGLAKHQRHCAFHTDTQNPHVQVAYNLIHPERLIRHEPFRDYRARDALCRELEKEYGLFVDKGREQGRAKDNEKAAAVEAQRGEQSFVSYARECKDSILQTLDAAKSWQDLHRELARHGLEIRLRGNGLIIKNRHGKQAMKASELDRRLSKKRLEAALGPFVPAFPMLTQEESRYRAKPIQRSPAAEALYVRYAAGKAARDMELAGAREKTGATIAAIREKWRLKRTELERLSILKHNRRNLLQLARKSEAAELAAVKAQATHERKAVNREQPCCSWQDFLRREAEQGSEIALAVLRSRQKRVKAETLPASRDYEELAILKADYTEKQVEVLCNSDLAAKGKKRLLAFLRMEQVAQEEKLLNTQAREEIITRSVDNKGVVVFNFAGGGKIRDCGSEVLFSADRADLALLYARKKWGPNLITDKGRIRFDLEERERSRETSLPPLRAEDQSLER